MPGPRAFSKRLFRAGPRVAVGELFNRLFQELRRRNVFRVALAYLASTWLALQVLELTLDSFSAPPTVMRTFLLAAALGLLLTLVLAWMFQVTPDGIRRQGGAATPVRHRRSRRFNRWLNLVIIVALSLAVVVLWMDRRIPGRPAPTVAKSIAVLPFTDLSQGRDHEWFADGLAEEILNTLTRTPDLLVSSRTSSFAFKGASRDAQSIARELGVAYLLEGSVRRSGDRVRVTAQLVRADDGIHSWSENYDRAWTDVIDIQEDLALQIANTLQTSMDPAALREMLQVGTQSAAAYRAYIHGVAQRNRIYTDNDIESYRRANAYFEEAREIDPGFSEAHRAAAEFWRIQLTPPLGGYMDAEAGDPERSFRNFHERNDRAIATAMTPLNRQLIEAEKADVNLRFRRAVALYKSYLEQRPGDWDAWLSYMIAIEMASDAEASQAALAKLKKSGATGTTPASIYMNFAYQHVDPSRAADFGLAAIERWPGHSDLLYQTHRTLLWAGRVAEAAEVVRSFELSQPEDALMLARQACAEGRRDVALQVLEDRRAAGITPGSTEWHILMMLGDTAAAEAVVRHYEADPVPNRAAAWLAYRVFDPTPFPSIMAVLERENIERPPADRIPFACPAD